MLISKFISSTTAKSDLQFYKIFLVVGEDRRVLVSKCLPVSNLLSILGDDLRIEIDKETRIEFEPTK